MGWLGPWHLQGHEEDMNEGLKKVLEHARERKQSTCSGGDLVVLRCRFCFSLQPTSSALLGFTFYP